MNNAYKILDVNHEGKRQLGRFRPRWEDNIKTDFKEIGCDGVGSINLAWDTNHYWLL
jgi:hypothetical protein